MPTSSEPVTAPEVRLVLMLCRYPADRIDVAEAAGLCAQISEKNTDFRSGSAAAGGWEHFLKLAAHHRVMPLISTNARVLDLPTHVTRQLQSYAAKNAIEAFRSLAEMQRVTSLLASATIDTTVLKGVPLSLQAYGDVATRDVGDLDLLLRTPQDADEADRHLQRSGYLRKEPRGRLTPRRRNVYARHFKDYTYEPTAMATRGGFEVDLHWRLFRSPLMPGNELADMETISVSAGSVEINTLHPAAHLAYLCVQGALDGWTRFKSIADIAALWNVADKAAVLALAREAATLPYLFAALILADGWIGGIDLPEGFRLDSCLQHPVTRFIVEHARQKMVASDFLPALRETSSWRMKRYEASLYNNRDYKWGIARRVLFRPRVWNRFDLPDTLFPLYSLLSPVEWALFHLRNSKKPS